MADSNVRVLADPESPLDVAHVLTDSAKQAQDVLLVCYVGHGLVSSGRELHLATKSTNWWQPELFAYTALAYTEVSTLARGHKGPPMSLVVILDCCFSGKAVDVRDDAVAVYSAQVHREYVLTSSGREESAFAPLGVRHTAFMGELIGLLTRGDPDGPSLLTLRYAHQYLNRVLPARGFAEPRYRPSEGSDDLVLAPNPACHPPGDAPSEHDAAGPAGDVCPYPGPAFELRTPGGSSAGNG